MNKHTNADILRLKDAAEYLQISLPTLWRYSKQFDDFPKKIQLTVRCCAFRKSDLDAWIKSREVN